MSEFMHKLAEGLRTREQLLEDHNDHPAFLTPEGDSFRDEYESLTQDLKAFVKKLEKAREKDGGHDEHFEKTIKDENHSLMVKIDSWSKKINS